jgi:membrane protein YqaA with SNARE-associated domain
MGGLVDRLRVLALALGAPGLLLIAFLDSSVLSLPEIADLLVIYMVTHHKHRLIIYVVATTLGSIAGCLVMYYIGREGGEALVRKRFASGNVERAMASVKRHGLMAVLIPSILPPPAPFKIFVLIAGASGVPVARFATAVAIGRGARYLALGLLAVRYGDRTLAYIHENGTKVSLAAVGVLILGFGAYLAWTKARGAKSR